MIFVFPIHPEKSLEAIAALAKCPDHSHGSRIQSDSQGWEGHGQSNYPPCAVAAHPSDRAVRDLSPRFRRGATWRRRRSLWGRSLWRGSLWWAFFRHAFQRRPHGRALRLAALGLWKALCRASGSRNAFYFGSFASSAVTAVEPHAGPHAIRFADSANPSLVSAAISTPPRRSIFLCSFSRARSSRVLLQPPSAIPFLRMLLEQWDP